MSADPAARPHTQDERHAQLANEEYEAIGRLYAARFGRLRPGKNDMFQDSMSDENVRQFSDWLKHEALTDALFRVIELERQLGSAGAYLLVAAPDLLALAEQYAVECAECLGTGQAKTLDANGYPAGGVDCEACAAIRAAISKAKGDA